ncbi:hypothetical protein SEA_MAKAI_58 [Arthrobacter phage Makai]|nr:hypothetical protein SEA_MAKAI_58 [Arthrobacter phage Makai]QPX62520.1 hypothetical protein SEA_TRUCKEE_56 [Arthrobacter phage Truckee]
MPYQSLRSYSIYGGSAHPVVDPSSVPFKEFLMKKEVVQFECDNCHEESPEEDIAGHPRRTTLPEDWAHIVGNTNRTRLFDLDLCTKCVEAMRKALLRRSKVGSKK